MTEFEEIALKKIIKEFLIENVYYRINLLIGKYGISNAEISKRIGWDPAGYNQKYNRSNDLRMSTFIKIYVALLEIIGEKEKEYGFEDLELSKIDLNKLITEEELDIARLFNHISAAAEGKTEFLCSRQFAETYLSLKSFVLLGRKNNKFSNREIDVYITYYKTI